MLAAILFIIFYLPICSLNCKDRNIENYNFTSFLYRCAAWSLTLWGRCILCLKEVCIGYVCYMNVLIGWQFIQIYVQAVLSLTV